MSENFFDSLYVHEDIADTPSAIKASSLIPNHQIVRQSPLLSDLSSGKKVLYLSPKHGDFMGECASLNPEYICCNFHVIHGVRNCPFGCHYCFLQNYLNNTVTTVCVDSAAILNEIRSKTTRSPDQLFRIGNWELGDSLALDDYTTLTPELIVGFSRIPNAILELRTKSDQVDHLLSLRHDRRTVISFSLNPQAIITKEEPRTASLGARLNAMKKITDAGYLTALHFDPMLLFEGWREGYFSLVQDIFNVIEPSQVAWISIGSLRFNPEMKQKIQEQHPESKLTHAEMIAGPDRKMRYFKRLRIELYPHLIQQLKLHGAGHVLTYLCMERWDVWNHVLGSAPRSSDDLDRKMGAQLKLLFKSSVNQPITPVQESDY